MPDPLAADLEHIGHTAGLWDDFGGNRIFITGGTGFFGCQLRESFAWTNDKLDLGAHLRRLLAVDRAGVGVQQLARPRRTRHLVCITP